MSDGALVGFGTSSATKLGKATSSSTKLGKDALDDCETNADCAAPFPLRSYVPPAYAPPPPPAFRQEACEASEAGWQCLCCAQTECAGHFCAHRRCCFPEGESAGEAECQRECEHAGDVLVS